MALNLSRKTVLITGSSDGLGKLLATNLAQLQMNVILHGRDEEKLKRVLTDLNEIHREGNHSYVVCDLSKPEVVSGSFSKIDKLDILVNNAGVWNEGDTLNVNSEKIIEMVNVNLASYILVFRALLPRLLESEFAQLLNVASVAGYEVPSGYYHTVYSATKYGIQGFSEATAKEFEGKNLRIMGFYPGGMNTHLFVKAGLDYKQNESWMFDVQESVDAIIFMLTRNKKISVKRLDLINQLFE